MSKLRANKKEEVQVVKPKKVEPKKKVEKEVEKIEVIDVAVSKGKEVKEAESVKSAEVVKEAFKKEPTVRICTDRDVRTYIGDQWYNLKAGKNYNVSQTVKSTLLKAGYLVVT